MSSLVVSYQFQVINPETKYIQATQNGLGELYLHTYASIFINNKNNKNNKQTITLKQYSSGHRSYWGEEKERRNDATIFSLKFRK